MSAPHMLRRRGSTPSYFEQDQFRPGLQYVMRPDSGMAYRGNPSYVDGSYMPSGASTMHNSPQPSHIMYDEWRRPYLLRGESHAGIWRSYMTEEGFGEPTLWPYRSNEYQRPVILPQYNYPNPQLHGQGDLILASDHSSAHQTPRGTPDLEPNITLSRTPPSKRKKAVKPKDKVKRAALEKPLSELTKDLTQVPVKDTEAWVNRSFEERKAEKRDDGSIKRPSNSFMLYRSAYTERCRELEKSKNHQDISSIAGASWALETPAIKAQFEEWARVERENHQKAFPDYKFQPQTQAAKERKRKRKSDEASDETSDLEDPTWHNGRGVLEERAKSARNKTPRSTYREYSNSPSFTSQDEASTPEPYMLSQNSSYIPDINLGKPLPMAMDRQSDYHHITSQPNTAYHAYDYAENYQYVDNAAFETYDSVSPPIGLPGGSHVDLMGDSSLDAGQMMFPSPSLLDPELQSHDHISQVQAQALVSMAPPGSARSTVFHAGDYLNEGDSTPYLTSFDHVSLDN